MTSGMRLPPGEQWIDWNAAALDRLTYPEIDELEKPTPFHSDCWWRAFVAILLDVLGAATLGIQHQRHDQR